MVAIPLSLSKLAGAEEMRTLLRGACQRSGPAACCESRSRPVPTKHQRVPSTDDVAALEAERCRSLFSTGRLVLAYWL